MANHQEGCAGAVLVRSYVACGRDGWALDNLLRKRRIMLHQACCCAPTHSPAPFPACLNRHPMKSPCLGAIGTVYRGGMILRRA